MSILIQKPGIFTTVQNLGRYGYRRFGINPGGVMDRDAVRLVNNLLAKEEDATVLEMHFPAPQMLFEREATIVIGGAEFEPRIDDRPIPCWAIVNVRQGSTLTFLGKKLGNRAYLAIRPGLDVGAWLGSRSTNLSAKIGGFSGRRLEAGDRIEFDGDMPIPSKSAQISLWFIPKYSSSPTLRVLPGAEFEKLTEAGRQAFLNGDFKISNKSDRMGFRLKGDPVDLLDPDEMVSSPVSFGTIQLLPDRQMIILMADHQSTGGYPRLANVITRDLPLLAQLGPGDKVSFQLVTQCEAEKLEVEFARHLSFLRVGSRFESARSPSYLNA